MPALMIGLYFLLCVLLSFAGRRTRVGAAGMFILSVLFTPLLVGLILAVLGPAPKSDASSKRRGA